MINETTVTAKTVELAVEKAAAELNVAPEILQTEVIEQPKRGILGLGASDAVVKAWFEITPAMKAKEFLETLIKNIEISASVEVKSESEEGIVISVDGEGLGLLIGRHGDVLDSIQHLASLAANRGLKGFCRVTVDIEGYREKREETLKTLARRTAERVLKYKRNITLEPMNPNERRLIHSEVQNIEGVTSYSIGVDDDRRIVIAIEKKKKSEDKADK